MNKNTNDIVLAILKYLEGSLGELQIDYPKIDHEALGIPEPRYYRILTMMLKKGYIRGLSEVQFESMHYPMNVKITTYGLKYIRKNKPSFKVYEILNEIKDWTTSV